MGLEVTEKDAITDAPTSLLNDTQDVIDQTEEVNGLSPQDIKHNLKVLILMDAIFVTGATELQIALGPMWKFLHASNTTIGLVGSMTMISLIGVVLAPFISLRCRVKKWYLLISHIPYLGAIGVMGVGVLFSRQMHLSSASILSLVVAAMAAHYFFAGFVTLPHSEYTAACIPMSHRGRLSGYGSSVGSALAMLSAAVGVWFLLRISPPASFGYLLVMMWLICQSGYILALFGRERPTPVQKAPKAWSKAMLLAAWHDKPFLKVVLLYVLYSILFTPVFSTYVSQYGLRELRMIDASAAGIAFVMQILRIVFSGPIGHFTDAASPKRITPLLPLLGCVSILPVLLVHNQYAVYVTMGLSALYFTAFWSAFFALLYGLPSPENRSGHYTVQILASNVAAAIGPVVTGAMCDCASYRTTFAVVAFLALGLAMLSHRILSSFSADPKSYS